MSLNRESEAMVQGLDIPIEIIDDLGYAHSLGFRESSLSIISHESNLSFILPDKSNRLARFLISRHDDTYLQSEIRKEVYTLSNYRIAPKFDEITAALGAHSVRRNFVSFGSGNSTKYGFLLDARDRSLLIKRGLGKIDESSISNRRKEKQKKQFQDFQDYFEGDDDKTYSKKKIVGAVAASFLVTIGGTTYYLYKNKQHD